MKLNSHQFNLKLFIRVVLIIKFSLFSKLIFSQSSPIPSSTNVPYENSLTYSNTNNSYSFHYSGNDCSLSYNYDLANGGSFRSIKLNFGNYEFFPSYSGGVCLTSAENVDYCQWSEEIKNDLLKSRREGDTVITEWVMKKGNEFYFHYQFKISILGKTLIIRTKDLGKIENYSIANYVSASMFHLDRCEGAIDPEIIGIPYLNTMNILYTNKLFASIFFDWTRTNSSQILHHVGKFSNSSNFFSQHVLYKKNTDGMRNSLDETIYMTVSPEIEEVFPNIPNPVSKYKTESVNRLVYDNWETGFDKILNTTVQLRNAGIDSLWLIVHNWQNAGYDNKYPDVLPANSDFGGNEGLMQVRQLCKNSGYLFSLHENYSDFYPNAPSYNEIETAVDSRNTIIKGWKNNNAQAYLLKPTLIKKYLIPVSTDIHNTFETNASFIDVLTARNPSENIDYDGRVENSNKFLSALKITWETGEELQRIHNGPVSGEGGAHFLYAGYFDDFEPQIHTASDEWSGDHPIGGYYQPLLVNFDLLKIKPLIMAHGVGYYERFFHKDRYWKYMGRSMDSALSYSATELAYGHGGFFSTFSYNIIEQASIEYKYVYPVQILYGDAKAVKIFYNDHGNLISASDYIKKYPQAFRNFNDENFMSQVMIEYNNGVKIYVNRHPSKDWKIQSEGNLNGWFSYHALINGEKVLYKGNELPSNITLPKSNGWFCYVPF